MFGAVNNRVTALSPSHHDEKNDYALTLSLSDWKSSDGDCARLISLKTLFLHTVADLLGMPFNYL